MSEVSPIGQGQGSVGSVGRVKTTTAQHNGVVPGRVEVPRDQDRDRVELSDRARLINRLRELPEVRADRVAAARQAIEDPNFASDERLNVALERLIDDLNLDEQFG